MARTAAEVDPRLLVLVLPSTPGSVRAARFHVQATLSLHGLDDYAEDAATITSELVTNAVQHVHDDGSGTIGVTLTRGWNPPTVTIVVSDSSPAGPRKCDPSADGERGRGLRIVEALSAHWGWQPQEGGKAIFATLAQEA